MKVNKNILKKLPLYLKTQKYIYNKSLKLCSYIYNKKIWLNSKYIKIKLNFSVYFKIFIKLKNKLININCQKFEKSITIFIYFY